MAQVSKYLRKGAGIYVFYCPGCKEAHQFSVPRWKFDGDVDKPTFEPSLRMFTTDDEDDLGNKLPKPRELTICHLVLTKGNIFFCADSDHDLKGKTVPLPELPEYMQGDKYGDGDP